MSSWRGWVDSLERTRQLLQLHGINEHAFWNLIETFSSPEVTWDERDFSARAA